MRRCPFRLSPFGALAARTFDSIIAIVPSSLRSRSNGPASIPRYVRSISGIPLAESRHLENPGLVSPAAAARFIECPYRFGYFSPDTHNLAGRDFFKCSAVFFCPSLSRGTKVVNGNGISMVERERADEQSSGMLLNREFHLVRVGCLRMLVYHCGSFERPIDNGS